MKSQSVIQMKAIGQYFPVVLFITLYKAFLRFESLDEICVVCNSFQQCCSTFPVFQCVILKFNWSYCYEAKLIALLSDNLLFFLLQVQQQFPFSFQFNSLLLEVTFFQSPPIRGYLIDFEVWFWN